MLHHSVFGHVLHKVRLLERYRLERKLLLTRKGLDVGARLHAGLNYVQHYIKFFTFYFSSTCFEPRRRTNKYKRRSDVQSVYTVNGIAVNQGSEVSAVQTAFRRLESRNGLSPSNRLTVRGVSDAEGTH